MDLFGSFTDMAERDMKESVYESVYYTSLGSSPLFPDLVWPAAGLDSSLDQLDPGIMVDPAVVVPRRQTEQHLQPVTPKSREDSSLLPDILSNSKLMRLELDESTDEEDDEFDDDRILGDSDDDEEEVVQEQRRIVAAQEKNRRFQHTNASNTLLISKKGQKMLSSGVIKVKRSEVLRTSNGVRSPSSSQVRSPTVVRSPSTYQTVRSPSTQQAVRSPALVRSASVDSSSSSPRQSTSLQEYPKPAYSYSCLIAMALKNSPSGSLPVSEIYNFMCEHFPFFKSARSNWKNSVRHNLSLNKGFRKIEKSLHGSSRKGCMWALNPARISKMDEEMAKWSKKDPQANMRAMAHPETLDKLMRGEMKIKLRVSGEEDEEDTGAEEEDQGFTMSLTPAHIGDHRQDHGVGEEDEEEEQIMSSEQDHDDDDDEEEEEEEEEEEDDQSDEEGEVPPSLKPFDRQLNARLNPQSEHHDIGVEFSEEVYEELGLLEEVLEEADVYRVPPVKRERLDHHHRSHAQSYRHAITSLQ